MSSWKLAQCLTRKSLIVTSICSRRVPQALSLEYEWRKAGNEEKVNDEEDDEQRKVRIRKKWEMKKKQTNYNSKREDLEEEHQGEDERNVIL